MSHGRRVKRDGLDLQGLALHLYCLVLRDVIQPIEQRMYVGGRYM